jgi:hypothetical protein
MEKEVPAARHAAERSHAEMRSDAENTRAGAWLGVSLRVHYSVLPALSAIDPPLDSRVPVDTR